MAEERKCPWCGEALDPDDLEKFMKASAEVSDLKSERIATLTEKGLCPSCIITAVTMKVTEPPPKVLLLTMKALVFQRLADAAMEKGHSGMAINLIMVAIGLVDKAVREMDAVKASALRN